MAKIIDLFEQHLGVHEYEGVVADIQKWYWGKLVKEAWCATSESYFANEAGILEQLGGKNCGVWEMGEACKKLHQNDGTFFEYPNLPDIKKHDIIFLERKGASHVTNAYEDKAYKDSTATVKCLGGNQNDSICVKAYAMNKIQYIYRPYGNTTEGSKTASEGSAPTIMKGYKDLTSGGSWCAKLQAGLNTLGYRDPNGCVLVVDGSCGAKTDYAIRQFQAANVILTIDGHFGPKSWAVLLVLLGEGTFKVSINEGLYLRTAPNGAIKGTLEGGEKYTVSAISGKWFFLEEKQGWASSLFMTQI